MELSIREIKARFSEAAAAAARGERVVVTENGAPFVELVPAERQNVRARQNSGSAKRAWYQAGHGRLARRI